MRAAEERVEAAARRDDHAAKGGKRVVVRDSMVEKMQGMKLAKERKSRGKHGRAVEDRSRNTINHATRDADGESRAGARGPH